MTWLCEITRLVVKHRIKDIFGEVIWYQTGQSDVPFMKLTTIVHAVEKMLTLYPRPLQKVSVGMYLLKEMTRGLRESSPRVSLKYLTFENVCGTQKLGPGGQTN